jgi:hypothetical protein
LQAPLSMYSKCMKFPTMTIQLWDKDIVKFSDCIGELQYDVGKFFRKAYKHKHSVQCFEDPKPEDIQNPGNKSASNARKSVSAPTADSDSSAFSPQGAVMGEGVEMVSLDPAAKADADAVAQKTRLDEEDAGRLKEAEDEKAALLEKDKDGEAGVRHS